MKCRSGFVSNSSSSSFVVAGTLFKKPDIPTVEKHLTALLGEGILDETSRKSWYKKPYAELDEDEKRDILHDLIYDARNNGFAVLWGDDDGVRGDGLIVGKFIADSASDDGGLEFAEIDPTAIFAELEAKGIPGPYKLYCGTRLC